MPPDQQDGFEDNDGERFPSAEPGAAAADVGRLDSGAHGEGGAARRAKMGFGGAGMLFWRIRRWGSRQG